MIQFVIQALMMKYVSPYFIQFFFTISSTSLVLTFLYGTDGYLSKGLEELEQSE